jgi:hypothetical protein
MTAPKRRRWPLVVAIVLLGMTIATWLSLRFMVAPYLRGKLQQAVTDHFHADLQINSLRYTFPYGIVASGLKLEKDGKTLITADGATLVLAEFPSRNRPLLIKQAVLDRPMVEFERIAGDGTPWEGIIKKDAPRTPRTMKLSDLFELRHLAINDGRIEYTDHRVSESPSLVWEHLKTDLKISPQSAALYGFAFSADNGSVAHVNAAGAINIDDLLLDLQNLKITAKADPAAGESPLPPEVQKLMREMDLSGEVVMQVSGKVPLKTARDASGQVSIAIAGVRAKLGEAPLSADLQITATRPAPEKPVAITLDRVNLAAGSGTIRIPFASGEFDPQQKTWRLTKIDATVQDMTMRFGKLDMPFEHINGKLTTRDDTIIVESADAYCRDDHWMVAGAAIPLGDFRGGIDVHDIAMTVDFHQPGPGYAGGFGKTILALNPVGAVKIAGNYRAIFGARDAFDLHLSSDNAAMAIPPNKVPIVNVRSDIPITQEGATIRRLEGDLLGGRVEVSGTYGFHGEHAFAGDVTLRNVQMQSLAEALILPERGKRYSGLISANGSIRGAGDDLSKLHGSGEAQVVDGRLWEIPVFGGIASKTKIKSDALTATEAAAVFEIADAQVILRRAALNSDALGLDGNGRIGFDGQLDLEVIAAPLGDWKDRIKETRIPILSNFVGEVAGGLQKVINTATQQLLYQFHITGRVGKPEIQTVPAPLLSEAGAAIFAKMLRPGERLIDAVRDPKPAAPKDNAAPRP